MAVLLAETKKFVSCASQESILTISFASQQLLLRNASPASLAARPLSVCKWVLWGKKNISVVTPLKWIYAHLQFTFLVRAQFNSFYLAS